jgi:hypothetical protein
MSAKTTYFELRDAVAEDFQGGDVTIGRDGSSLNVSEALKSGSGYGPAGVIATEDPIVIEALDAYPPVKRASKPAGGNGGGGETKADLLERAEALGVEGVSDSNTKAEIEKAIADAEGGS